jgi:acyl-CoA synthetase (AMP-forming)/AMP-acid ligase II
LVAFVCGAQLAPAAAREELRKRVPAYMVPRRVIALNDMPLNSNGKTDRKALKKMLEEGTL